MSVDGVNEGGSSQQSEVSFFPEITNAVEAGALRDVMQVLDYKYDLLKAVEDGDEVKKIVSAHKVAIVEERADRLGSESSSYKRVYRTLDVVEQRIEEHRQSQNVSMRKAMEPFIGELSKAQHNVNSMLRDKGPTPPSGN